MMIVVIDIKNKAYEYLEQQFWVPGDIRQDKNHMFDFVKGMLKPDAFNKMIDKMEEIANRK